MSRVDEPAPEFSVVCVSPQGAHFRLRIAAPTAEEAVTLVKAQGHDARGAFADGLSREEQRQALEALRAPDAYCAACGYALVGLPEGERGVIICPECGARSGRRHPTSASDIDWISVVLVISTLLATVEVIRLIGRPRVPVLAVVGFVLAGLVVLLTGRRRGWTALIIATTAVLLNLMLWFVGLGLGLVVP